MLLEKSEPKVIKLADGKEYSLPDITISLYDLSNIEKTMGLGGTKLADKMANEPMSTLMLFAYASLKIKQPEITLDQAGKLITLNELKEFSDIVSIVMALG